MFHTHSVYRNNEVFYDPAQLFEFNTSPLRQSSSFEILEDAFITLNL